MAEISVILPDGSTRTIPSGGTAGDLAADIGPGLAKAALIATVDDVEVDLNSPLADGQQVAIITADSDAGLETLRHSTAHVLAQAVLEMYPGATYAVGPPIEDGFYYDFDLPDGATISDDDLEAIENRMREIIEADQPFERHEVSAAEGLELFTDHPYKREIIETVALASDAAAGGQSAGGQSVDELADEVAGDGQISYYRNSGFLHRLVPWPPRSVHRPPRALQADERGRGLLAPRCRPPLLAACLRYGLGVEKRPGRPPAPAGRGGKARPPPPGPRARPSVLAHRVGTGAGGVAPQRGCGAPHHRGLQPRPARRGWLPVGSHPPT